MLLDLLKYRVNGKSNMKSIKSFSLLRLSRIAFISPHPDDVELCCGILIKHLICSGIKVYYSGITNGAPSPEVLSIIKSLPGLPDNYNRLEYKTIRRKESIKALRVLGVDLAQVEFLNWPDLECYKHISGIIREFHKIMKIADGIFCCPFEGGHPDHDITRFALAVASRQIDYSGHIFEYASYNNRGYQIFQRDFPCCFTFNIKPQERKIKQQIAKIFVSQKEEMKQFRTDVERFRQANVGLNFNEYTSYETIPHYEQFAYPSSIVLKKIKEYLNSIDNHDTTGENK